MVAETKCKRLEIAIEDSSIVHVLKENQALRWRDRLPDWNLIYHIIAFSFTQKKKKDRRNAFVKSLQVTDKKMTIKPKKLFAMQKT